MSIWQRIAGGWKTHGPNSGSGPGAFDTDATSPYSTNVNADTAMKLSAFSACVQLRAETMGSLPIQVRDADKKIVTDHPVYDLLHRSPNAIQTPAEFISHQTACVDIHGNGISVVTRRANGEPISLESYDPTTCTAAEKKNGTWVYTIGGDKVKAEDVLHLKGFSLDGGWGLSRIDIGRNIIASQIDANDAAAMGFRQGLKIGGFFEMDRNLDTPEREEWKTILNRFGERTNAGKWLTLLKGMKPVSGAEFRMKPAEMELLASRAVGIEEICRLMCVPPQLIGHTDKASSWASSLEQINLFFLMYSLQPSFIRMEQRFNKTLLSAKDVAKGLSVKFTLQGLLRADMRTQALMFAQMLQNGVYNVDEVRDLLDRTSIPGGDEYRVQMNMGAMTAQDQNQNQPTKP